MNQTELMIALGAALFAAFLLGWLAGWLTHRAGGAAPAPAPATHPLPALGVLPAMLIMDTKKNPNFKPTKPYGKKTITSVG